MIYVSSFASQKQLIADAISELISHGISNIELTGGFHFEENVEKILLKLKDENNLNFNCHNYFPPPKDPFVINLASLDDDIYQASLNHVENALKLSELLGSKHYGFHAGFLFDIYINELGGNVNKNKKLNNKKDATKRFIESVEYLQNVNSVNLYIENNCYSFKNFEKYGESCPFLITDFYSYSEIRSKLDFNLLLDVAHLKVACNSLNYDFEYHFKNMSSLCDYFHISDNNALVDSNDIIKKDSKIFQFLKDINISDKIITLEIKDIKKALKSKILIESLVE